MLGAGQVGWREHDIPTGGQSCGLRWQGHTTNMLRVQKRAHVPRQSYQEIEIVEHAPELNNSLEGKDFDQLRSSPWFSE